MIKSYSLLKTLAGIGALWIILVIFFYPKPDQIVSVADVLFRAKHGEFFDVGSQKDEKLDLELESAKFVEILVNKNDENQKIEVKSRKATKPRSNKFQFTKPPNIFNTDSVGEFGVAVKMPKHLPQHIKKLYEDGWQKHEFNQYLSDLISVKRKLLDSRSDYCRNSASNLSKNLPSTSVIVIFHNEAWSTLLRTVHSVLDRSPEHLIEEVLLVDDFSDMDHLKEPLEDYFAKYPKVKILRGESREGLIKARIRGTLAAKAPTLTFLDSHVECTKGWLEPLLDRIAQNPTNVACPVITIINDETFEFVYQGDSRSIQNGGFYWKMVFHWQTVSEREVARRSNPSEPIRSPTMAGGLFSIDKAFFTKLGMYDPGFDIWGGENLELSFKIWMCGGNLEILPCSQVGHIYRAKSPYVWREGVDVIQKNTIRLAEVWLDEYAQYFYRYTNYEATNFGDISERVELRRNLNCKSFRWYMENVFPEQFDPSKSLAHGYIQCFADKTFGCLSMRKTGLYQPLKTSHCSDRSENLLLFYTEKGELRRDEICLEYNSLKNYVTAYYCHEKQGLQFWTFIQETNQFYHNHSSSCMTLDKVSMTVTLENCDATKLEQKWYIESLFQLEEI